MKPPIPSRKATDFKFGQAKPAAPSVAASAPKEEKTAYAPGTIIFQRGDAGGDLLFIEEGIVEIYNEKDGQTVVLSEMKAGEIIGVMTCLTKEPRMASAKARTTVVARKVSHDQVSKIVSSMPNWLHIVLKEFSIRLKQVNDQYMVAMTKIKKLEVFAITKVYTGTQLASTLAGCGEFLARRLDEQRVIFIEEVMDKLSMMLNRPREELEAILDVFQDAGLVRIEIEQERKRKYFTLENAQALSYFPQFVRETRSGPKRAILKTKFSNKEFRILMALAKYARRKLGDTVKTAKLSFTELTEQLEKATSCAFEPEALKQAADLELLTFEGTIHDRHISFSPQTVARTMSCVEAIRKLVVLESTGIKKLVADEQKQKDQAA